MTDPLFDGNRERVLITGVSGKHDAEYFLAPLCKIPKTLRHRYRPDLSCCAS
jgi:hypothetical protein